ncbi:universal stress protein [Bradyrhizobium lablabi]|uniref:universal stress protein n=1 Tax=Bradyrhizobium lablabi TaxID=722472 RepID=UPI0020125A3D|nr:universal stress protein [Bradyrhizobium lablabi]
MAIGYEPAHIPIGAAGIPATTLVFEEQRIHAIERAETAINVFETSARNSGLHYNCRTISAIPVEALAIASAAARLHDLTIALQPDFEGSTFDNDLSRELLFESGGPVLFMPYTFRGPFSPRRIGICWDGSRLASRALRDAMPLIEKAEALTVITIDDSGAIPDGVRPEQLVRHLALKDLTAELVRFPSARSEIQPTILSVAADRRLDLLVMGGYGHSRLQERLLGGVTRDMLHCMTVPTMMSH